MADLDQIEIELRRLRLLIRNGPRPEEVSFLRCSKSIQHQVSIESDSKRQVLQRKEGQSEYLVFAERRGEPVVVTVIAE